MQSWEEKVMERQKGRNDVNNLYQKLKEENRMDDLMRAISDAVYREQLFKEYGM